MSLMKCSLSWLLAGSLVGTGAGMLAGEAHAQSTPGAAERLGTDDDGADAFGDADPFELIHRAILAPTMSSEEFQRQQQQSINTEAEAFRRRQQEALRQQQTLELDTETGSDASIEEDAL